MKQVYTIAIETGLQNVGIAFLVISLNFPSPESDYAFLPLIAVTTLTGLPLWILLVVKMHSYIRKQINTWTLPLRMRKRNLFKKPFCHN